MPLCAAPRLAGDGLRQIRAGCRGAESSFLGPSPSADRSVSPLPSTSTRGNALSSRRGSHQPCRRGGPVPPGRAPCGRRSVEQHGDGQTETDGLDHRLTRTDESGEDGHHDRCRGDDHPRTVPETGDDRLGRPVAVDVGSRIRPPGTPRSPSPDRRRCPPGRSASAHDRTGLLHPQQSRAPAPLEHRHDRAEGGQYRQQEPKAALSGTSRERKTTSSRSRARPTMTAR